jgi:hypothetical protein
MNYGMQIGKDLAAYGEKIGLQIKDNRDKQQAMGSLPALQEAMQAFQAGDNAAGYSTLLGLAASDPSNQPLNNLIKLGFMGGQSIEESKYRTRMADAANARVAAATPSGPSGSERLRGMRVLPAMTTGDTQGEETITIDGENGTSNADFTKPTEIVPDNASAIDAANANKLPTDQVEQPKEELSEEQKNMVPQIRNFRTLAPADKQQVLSSATITQKPEGYEKRFITGLSELHPNLTGDMFIPEVGTKTTIKRTVSTSDKPGSEIRESFAEDNIKVGEKLYDFNSKSAENIPSAVNAMIKQAPFQSKKTFAKLFNENGGIENAVISPTVDPQIYTLFFNGNDKDKYSISDKQANNLSIAQSIPALAGSGVQFLGKEKSKEELSAADKVRQKFGKPVDDSTKTPPPPERKSEKTKAIDEKLIVLKEKKLVATAGKRKERIAQIDREIEEEGMTTSATMQNRGLPPMYSGSSKPSREKSQSELQASKRKILELEEEREKLLKVK